MKPHNRPACLSTSGLVNEGCPDFFFMTILSFFQSSFHSSVEILTVKQLPVFGYLLLNTNIIVGNITMLVLAGDRVIKCVRVVPVSSFCWLKLDGLNCNIC